MGSTEPITKNIKYAVAGEFLLAVLKFLSRRVFVLLLGREYLGLNGLFADVLSMLSLAELGFSVSITYSLYRPVAQGDTEMIKSLVQLYRRVYRTIGLAVLVLGLFLTPFLSFFFKEIPQDIPNIPLLYVLNLINASISYFFTYRSTILFVHQKKYIETSIRVVVSLAATAAQIAVLFLTRSYLCYLYIAIGATVIQNAALAVTTGRLFPYLREKNVRPLPAGTVDEINRNVRAMLLHRIGTVAVFHTDNLLIAKFVGVATAGLYSNYMMIRSFLNLLVNALFDTITATLGHRTATETEAYKQVTFRRLNFFSAWLFGWMSICLFCLYDSFIDIWLGKGYLLSRPAVLLLVLNFYFSSMRIPVNNTKSVLGLFWEDRYKSIVEAAINLVVSVLLVQRWGVEGIMAGTFISTMAVPFWCEPVVLCHRGLHVSAKRYFRTYLLYLMVTIMAGVITWLLCCTIGEGYAGFILKCLTCAAIPNLVYLAVYHRTEDFVFYHHMLKHALRKKA